MPYSKGKTGSMVSGERKAMVCLSVNEKPPKWVSSCLATSCLLSLLGWGLSERVCCLSLAWVSPCTTRGSFLIAPRHSLGILMQHLCCYSLKCLTKMERYRKRLLNSVLTSDQCLKPLKKKRRKIYSSSNAQVVL